MYYKDYIDQILLVYEQKKACGELPLNLFSPTPARLRNECLILCKKGLQRSDEKILRDFFDQVIDNTTYKHLIENCDIDKFRPLINFLTTPTIKSDHKNIELLAWLIDFEPRPLDRWEKQASDEAPQQDFIDPPPLKTDETGPKDTTTADPSPENAGKDISDGYGISTGTAINEPDKPKRKLHFKAITIPLAAITLAAASIPVYQYVKAVSTISECMYWTGDHYQSIPCDQKVYGSLVIPLDTEKLIHFKKITRPDTITEADINRVSYIRLNGDIEFYTRKGDHPVRTERTLHPLTEYIYQEHILPLKH